MEREWFGVVASHPRPIVTEWRRGALPSNLRGRHYCGKCGGSVGPGEYNDSGCANCRGKLFPWTGIVRLGAYCDPLRSWIHDIKYRRWEAIGWELGRHLGEALVHLGCDADVVVPIPTTYRRRLRRGIDHSALIASAVARRIALPLRQPLRRDPRRPQRTVAPSQRRANIRGSIHLRRFHSVRGRRIVLVDDVLTSGATFIETARTMIKEGGAASVFCAVLAVTDHRTRGVAQQDPGPAARSPQVE